MPPGHCLDAGPESRAREEDGVGAGLHCIVREGLEALEHDGIQAAGAFSEIARQAVIQQVHQPAFGPLPPEFQLHRPR